MGAQPTDYNGNDAHGLADLKGKLINNIEVFMFEVAEKIGKMNLIDLKNSADLSLDEYFSYANKNIKSLSSYERFSYFKIMLSKKGGKYSMAALESSRYLMDFLDFISLANYISLNSGDYKNQLMYLEEVAYPVGWVAREKVKCLLNCGYFNKAVDLIDELMQINPDFYRKFSSNMLYQLSDYPRVLRYSLPGSVEYKCAKLWFERKNLEKLVVTSLYTHYSQNQIAIQNFSSLNGGYALSGCLGVTPDRFSSALRAQLTDRLDNLGILGASLGHIKMIEEFLASERDVLIATESDAFVSYPWFDKILNLYYEYSFDFILCSDRHSNPLSSVDEISIINYQYPGRASGFDGYILNKKAARLILNEFERGRFNSHIDGRIIHWSYLNNDISMGVTSFPLFSQSFTSVFSVRTLLELNY